MSSSFQSITASNMKLTNISLFPPSADIEVDFTISNPTNRDLRLVKVNFDILIDNVIIGTVTATDKLLPANHLTTRQGLFHLGTLSLSIIENPPYTVKLSGEVIASMPFLFFVITRSQTIAEIQEIS